MATSTIAAPQLVINSRMLYSSWVPADPEGAAKLLPQGLKPAANKAIYMNQYVVDSADQTSGFGAYSLTYIGLDLDGRKAPDGVTPSRFFTHYFNSAEGMRNYVLQRGVPASEGLTTLESNGREVVATTHSGGVPIIRAVARVGTKIAAVARGQLTYVTKVGGKLIGGNYPYVGEIADAFELVSLEFLAKDHPVYVLRPTSPLQRIEGWCWYSPRDSFAYPGGEYEFTP